ncbi:MAG: glutamate--tRNA ligase [Chloroflexota bacterium]
MSLPPVRVRFAPSPTGLLHVGGVRTALYCYLLARQTGGSFILRIEDTDQERYNPESLANFISGMQYLGLDYDEGPDVGGDYGPYVQTERLELYQKYAQILLEKGLAYRCFATKEELAEGNEARKKAGLSPGYDRRYRDYDVAEAEKRAANGEPHVIRAKLPLEGTVTFKDHLRGLISVENDTLQDSVIIKSDGIPTYNFAVIVDDRYMKISHVLRGTEYISSMPLYTHLYDFLGWEPPVFVHLPLILSPTGKGKMSKREQPAKDGTVKPVFLKTFEEMGYLPEAMINYLALVGWSFDDKTEFMTRQELIERFSLDKINASAASWDYDKLDHFNGTYIRQLEPADLADRILPFVKKAGIDADLETLTKIAPFIQERLTRLDDAAEWVDFFFVETLPEFDLNLLVPRKMGLEDVPNILETAKTILTDAEFTHDALDTALRAGAEANGLKVGQLLQPVRVATAGKKVSPPLFESLEVLGKDKSLQRLEDVLQRLSKNGA